jgi:enoyl-[acyl-carrier-protein] reductase (NADH)
MGQRDSRQSNRRLRDDAGRSRGHEAQQKRPDHRHVFDRRSRDGLVHLAAVELAPYNILVNGFAPGPFLTNIAGGRLHREPETVAFMANTVPLKRVADPSELKGLALLLASDASSYITGTVTPIDGGTTAM